MSTEPPRPGAVPGWGQPQPDPSDQTPPTQPPAAAPAPAGGAIPGWGQAPAQPSGGAPTPSSGEVPGWGQPAASPPTSAPVEAPAPAAVPAAPPTSVPAAPPSPTSPPTGWGQSPAAPPPPSGPQPGWGGSPAAPGAGGQPPGTWNPQPAQSSGSSGCLKIILILVAIGAIGFFLLIAGLVILGNRLADEVGVNGDGTIGKACTIIDNATLRDQLGGNAEAIELTGFYDATIGIILDKRVLPDAYDCWITADESTPVGRIARYEGSDAASVFQAERQRAAPTSQDQGGGVSVENSGYFAGDVSGLGDEAFCTGVSPAIQAGVLVRKGDTLVYVSLSGPSDGSTPDFGITDDGVVTAPSICATAQGLAARILP